jgi:geranylgeranyl diphosphate synthase type II
MHDLRQYLARQRDRVDAALDGLLPAPEPPRPLVLAMRHSLMAGGKRLRPVLCMAAAEAVGNADAGVLRVACAIEMIHTYSLIHDDLPAMDNDDLRRGVPTCHKAFDEATAILAGDALLTLAFEILAGAPAISAEPRRCCEVIAAIARAAGPAGMIEGQMRDMDSEGQRLALPELEALHRLKTGALIEAAIFAGARLGGGSTEEIEALGRYARLAGLAFQVTDDILNVAGDPQRLGKAVGSDAARRKSTYPALMGLDASRRHARQLVREALQAIARFDMRAEPLRALAEHIAARNR